MTASELHLQVLHGVLQGLDCVSRVPPLYSAGVANTHLVVHAVVSATANRVHAATSVINREIKHLDIVSTMLPVNLVMVGALPLPEVIHGLGEGMLPEGREL